MFATALMLNAILAVVVGVIQQAKDLGVSMTFLLPLLPYIVITMLPFTIPAALLLSVCVVYSRASSDNELVALKAAGISPFSALQPAIFLGVTVSLATLLLMNHGIPWAAVKVENAVFRQMDEIALNKLRTTQVLDHPSSNVKVMVAGMDGRRLISPVFDIPQGDKNLIVQAAEATFRIDPIEQVIQLSVTDAVIEFPGDSGESGERISLQGNKSLEFSFHSKSKPRMSYRMSEFDIEKERTECLQKVQQFKERQAIEMMFCLSQADYRFAGNVGEMTKEQRRVERRHRKLKTEKHFRHSMAWSCLCFTLIGSPLSIIMSKRHFLTTFMVCFAPLIGIYYPVVLGVIVQCKEGTIDPTWGVWIGNAILCIASTFLLRHVRFH